MFFFFNDTATTEIYTLSLHDALPILNRAALEREAFAAGPVCDQAETRARVHFDAARFIQGDGRPRSAIGHESLTNAQLSRSRLFTKGMPSNARCAFQTGNIP